MSRVVGRIARTGALVALVVAVSSGCIHESLRAGVLTPDTSHPDDDYDLGVDESGTLITASAPAANTGGNTRWAFWRVADQASTDQQSCATWVNGDANSNQQQGAALRIRKVGDVTRAITVTKNVWGPRSTFNVHVMDSNGPVLTLLEQFPLSGFSPLPQYPWRMCARVIGDQVSFVVWPTDRPQPTWGDPAYGGTTTLPSGWDQPGIPGFYIGHLAPGESVGFTDISVQELP
jgi:hypothetical protein